MSTEPTMPLNRREWLTRTTAGFGLLGLRNLIAGTEPVLHHAPRAKRVIFLFMNGAPSHVDTFDPKPALAQYEGKMPEGDLYRKKKGAGFMPSPFAFSKHGQSGMDVCETLPGLASVIDDCCVIRSMHTDVPNHEPGLLMMHTGNIQPIRPSIGSWCLYGLGTENQNLPGYVVLRPGPGIVVGPALWSNSFLPADYQATSVLATDIKVEKLVNHIRNPHLDLPAQRRQLDLLGALNRRHLASRDQDNALEAQIQSMETAFRMQTEAGEVFDISREPQSMREMYGETPFGRSVLLARRLSEAGVRFISVYYTPSGNQPWDTHAKHNINHPKLCADSDRASSALIRDLKQRGLLEDTLVIWSGEFGRTPYSQRANEKTKTEDLGRDHHHTAFTTLLAGGGVRGGLAYGASDEFGMNAVESPVHVHDLHATILHQLGLDHTRLTYRYSGRDFRLTDVHGQVLQDILT